MNSHFMTHAFQSRFLEFSLGQDRFAIPLHLIREVTALSQVRPEAQIPVIDLTLRLGLKSQAADDRVVIFCSFERFSVGLIVDAVQCVFVPAPEQFTAHDFSPQSRHTDVVVGVFRLEGRSVWMMNPESVLSVEEQEKLTPTTKTAA
ncbi:MAG: chemotaxis protein CheW [Bdellovibrionales bacterium]|nr:chemotaxis protein CheW [Bdellovibrionales bacterium]